ncbi:MAG: hypothetical protein Q4E37_04325 [Tissierellia bacterium]|nr:hypothetical protein [Tissierellia bacterium]
MSKFLGPIHYWLYNKIGHQEEINKTLASLAQEKGWIQDGSAYYRDLPPLEEVIDQDNIHGWLQSEIAKSETAYASLVTQLLDEDPSRLEALKDQAQDLGRAHPVPQDKTPLEIYQYFEDFFISGMPCDHVNSLTHQEDTQVRWKMTQDIHAPYWENSTKTYYLLRQALMEGMLEKTPYKLLREDPSSYRLEKNEPTPQK